MSEAGDGLGSDLVRRALQPLVGDSIDYSIPRDPRQSQPLPEMLDAHDPDTASDTVWRALTLLSDELSEGSAWKVRVQGLQRRNHYGATIAEGCAVTASEALRNDGIDHAIFGDLSLATQYRRRGDRLVNRLAIAVDPRISRARLTDCIRAMDGLTIESTRRNLVTGRFDSMPTTFHRGWSPLMGGRRLSLEAETEAETGTDADAGLVGSVAFQQVPRISAPVEVLRLFVSDGDPENVDHGSPAWLLDLAMILRSRPDAARQATALASRLSVTEIACPGIDQARRFGIDAVPAPARTTHGLRRAASHMAIADGSLARRVGQLLLEAHTPRS